MATTMDSLHTTISISNIYTFYSFAETSIIFRRNGHKNSPKLPKFHGRFGEKLSPKRIAAETSRYRSMWPTLLLSATRTVLTFGRQKSTMIVQFATKPKQTADSVPRPDSDRTCIVGVASASPAPTPKCELQIRQYAYEAPRSLLLVQSKSPIHDALKVDAYFLFFVYCRDGKADLFDMLAMDVDVQPNSHG